MYSGTVTAVIWNVGSDAYSFMVSGNAVKQRGYQFIAANQDSAIARPAYFVQVGGKKDLKG